MIVDKLLECLVALDVRHCAQGSPAPPARLKHLDFWLELRLETGKGCQRFRVNAGLVIVVVVIVVVLAGRIPGESGLCRAWDGGLCRAWDSGLLSRCSIEGNPECVTRHSDQHSPLIWCPKSVIIVSAWLLFDSPVSVQLSSSIRLIIQTLCLYLRQSIRPISRI
ncbi:hypothetical protein KQX54_015293 [Cotesia glomerata]|uniref:Uncharacterized protein n=1 Tax=Cotesia glomerata TaxID=32391 RepID=A0AAV7IT21_COTGL|nr:hypothetical protein KQX54_015293 [Cotesia glomerata]